MFKKILEYDLKLLNNYDKSYKILMEFESSPKKIDECIVIVQEIESIINFPEIKNKDNYHDNIHFRSVALIATYIASELNINKSNACLSGFFHDIGRLFIKKRSEDHSKESVKIFKSFARDIGFLQENQIKEIESAILNHNQNIFLKEHSLGACLRDADRICLCLNRKHSIDIDFISTKTGILLSEYINTKYNVPLKRIIQDSSLKYLFKQSLHEEENIEINDFNFKKELLKIGKQEVSIIISDMEIIRKDLSSYYNIISLENEDKSFIKEIIIDSRNIDKKSIDICITIKNKLIEISSNISSLNEIINIKETKTIKIILGRSKRKPSFIGKIKSIKILESKYCVLILKNNRNFYRLKNNYKLKFSNKIIYDISNYITKTEKYIVENDIFNDLLNSIIEILKCFDIKTAFITGRLPLRFIQILKNNRISYEDNYALINTIDDIDICIDQSEKEKLVSLQKGIKDIKLSLKTNVSYFEFNGKQQVRVDFHYPKYKFRSVFDFFIGDVKNFICSNTSIQYDVYNKKYKKSQDNVKKISNSLNEMLLLNDNIPFCFQDGILKELLSISSLINNYKLNLDNNSMNFFKKIDNNVKNNMKFYLTHDINSSNMILGVGIRRHLLENIYFLLKLFKEYDCQNIKYYLEFLLNFSSKELNKNKLETKYLENEFNLEFGEFFNEN